MEIALLARAVCCRRDLCRSQLQHPEEGMAVCVGGCSQHLAVSAEQLFQLFPGSPGDGSNTLTASQRTRAAPLNSCTASRQERLKAFGTC